jgi:hypothetical protein
MGAGEPEPILEQDPIPLEDVMEQVPSFDQATLEAMVNNLKGLLDSWKADEEQQAKQRQGLQDQLNQQHLKWAEDAHILAMRTADAGAVLINRTGNNAATWDNLIYAGEIQTTAQDTVGAKLAEEFRSAAKQAVEAAVAAVPGTSAASQGTTGVAQGSLQVQNPIELAQVLTNNISVQTALLATMADMNAALKVILEKVTGSATA